MYEIKNNWKSNFVGTVPSSYEKTIYRAADSQRLRNNAVNEYLCTVWSFLAGFFLKGEMFRTKVVEKIKKTDILRHLIC